jgi:quercetin dioxygenase-like cupin family protein
MTRPAKAFFALLGALPSLAAAQAPPSVAMEQEPHHHLTLKNDAVKVYAVELPSHDALAMHRHDHDDIVVVIRDATTVTSAPGQADVLRTSKAGEVRFSQGGRVHSVRNIGPSSYRFAAVELLRDQTGARNLCGKQIAGSPPNCPVAAVADPDSARVDVPQFETDQTRVVLTRIRAHGQAAFGERDRDELTIAMSSAAISAAARKEPEETLNPGEPVWIPNSKSKRILRNNSDMELNVVTISIEP